MVPRSSQRSVNALHHRQTRKNIPTEELRDFAPDEPHSIRTTLRWPRDPALDPQLVWQGKDEADSEELEVPVVPIYIQEKLHPRAIIEDLRSTFGGRAEEQFDMFADFNGIHDLRHKLEFYQHDQHWSNRLILGDSLLVMTSLAEKEGLRGKVQCIYMDPPYGVKFNSNWQVSTRKSDVRDGRAQDTTRQPEQVRAFRDTWKLGVHTYLSYLRDRLTVARDLLTDTGSVFMQIGDENLHRVRAVMDEVFGSENFIATISFRKKTMPFGTRFIEQMNDFIIWYAKTRVGNDKSVVAKYRKLFRKMDYGPESGFRHMQHPDGSVTRVSSQAEEISEDAAGGKPRLATSKSLEPSGPMSKGMFRVNFCGQDFDHPRRGYSTAKPGISRLAKAGRLMPAGNLLRYVLRADDKSFGDLTAPWNDTVGADDKRYAVQTNSEVLKRCILMTTDPGDLVLDPTCGSGTTAYVAEQWGRRWITIDTSRVALTLARTRLMAARYPYYLLADSRAGRRREAEVTGLPAQQGGSSNDVRQGFVYDRAPHITLRDIANSKEIDTLWSRLQPEVEDALAALNHALRGHEVPFESPTGGRAGDLIDFTKPDGAPVVLPSGELAPANGLLEWEVPRRPPADWPEAADDLLNRFWQARLARQRAIDASIARNAQSEVLYDQPYEDRKKVRVAGPFTVESLSPHRILAADDETPVSVRAATDDPYQPDFTASIIENLAKAGVQNTKRSERLKFERLEPLAGDPDLHAEGEFEDANGFVRRVAVSIGPEHGTVGTEQIGRAARAAVRGVGYDLLVICGFAFDAHADEKAREFAPPIHPEPSKGPSDHPRREKEEANPGVFAVAEAEPRYGRLPVMLARMNPDLSMGDDLLKKTGAGNLFTVFGEPDVRIERTDDGQVVVELHGVDVYDPTSGEVRSSSTEDIACWFIDTRYDEQSFFVRHAYFTGAGDPYQQLKRALRAEIDPDAWASIYQTRSRSFPPPTTGRIAVKVINHYGDEVLKVYEVA